MGELAGRNTGRMWHGNGQIIMVAPGGQWSVWPSQATEETISLTDTIELVHTPG